MICEGDAMALEAEVIVDVGVNLPGAVLLIVRCICWRAR
jgi:hypothetical protein